MTSESNNHSGSNEGEKRAFYKKQGKKNQPQGVKFPSELKNLYEESDKRNTKETRNNIFYKRVKDTKQEVVIKAVHCDSKDQTNKIHAEEEILKKQGLHVNSHHIGKYCYVVMENVLGDDLADKREAYQNAQDKKAKSAELFIDCLKARDALKSFHDTGYAHRDVKPDNFKNGRLLDFGNAILQENARDNYVAGCSFFLAPEARPDDVADSKINDQSSDYWSFGVMLAYMTELVELKGYLENDVFTENKQSHINKLRELHDFVETDAEKLMNLIIKLTLPVREARGTLENVVDLDEIVKKYWPKAYEEYSTSKSEQKTASLHPTNPKEPLTVKMPLQPTVQPIEPVKQKSSVGDKIINSYLFKLFFGCFMPNKAAKTPNTPDPKAGNVTANSSSWFTMAGKAAPKFTRF